MGCAPTRRTGPFKSEKRFSWMSAAISAQTPPSIGPSSRTMARLVFATLVVRNTSRYFMKKRSDWLA